VRNKPVLSSVLVFQRRHGKGDIKGVERVGKLWTENNSPPPHPPNRYETPLTNVARTLPMHHNTVQYIIRHIPLTKHISLTADELMYMWGITSCNICRRTSTRTHIKQPCLIYRWLNTKQQSYVYWTVHHCDSWRITDKLDATIY